MNFGWHASSWAFAGLLALPILALVFLSLSPDTELFAHLAQTVLFDYTLNTILLMLGVCLLSLVLALPAAWLMAMCRVPGQSVLQWALMLPLAMPSYIIAYVYTDLLDFAGPIQRGLRDMTGWGPGEYWFPDIRSLGGAICMLALVLYPYLYLMVRTSFLEQPKSLLQSSRLLGASAAEAFWRIALPLARPAIAIGLSLVAMETLADFAAVNYFAVNTLTTAVYDTWLGYGSLSASAKLSVLMMVGILSLLILERYSRRRQKLYQKSMGQEQDHRIELQGWHKGVAVTYCWALVGLGFILPALVLLQYAYHYFDEAWSGHFFRYSINSLTISTVVSVLAVALAIWLGFYRRLGGQRKHQLPSRYASMGYAVPGTVLAIGVLAVLTRVDFMLNDNTIALADKRVGLVFSGSMMALIFAYLVRFSAVSIGAVETSIGKISPSLEMVSRTLGEKPSGMLRRVHLPLIRKGVLTAVLLVFIESMKELPAALLLRPFNFETLATYVYQYVSDEMLEHASIGALVIVIVGLLPLIWLNRSLEQKY